MSDNQFSSARPAKTWLPIPAPETHRVIVGVLAAPELATQLVDSITDELAGLLHDHVDDRRDWEVFAITDPLIGAEDNTVHILAKAEELKQARGWQYVVCVTDLPMFRERRLTVAEASEKRGVAVLSLPTLGAFRLTQRLREAFLQLVNELYHGSSARARQQQQKFIGQPHQRQRRRRHGLRNNDARELLAKRFLEQLAPIQRQRIRDDAREIDVRFVSATRIRGFVKLLAGMIRANRPWAIIPTFRRILAVAFATGTYGLLFQTFWRMSDAYDTGRFIVLMLAAIVAMVIWLIIDHDLWIHQRASRTTPLTRIYNLTTVITLLVGVVSYYVMLFVLFLVAVAVLVPPELFAKVLTRNVGLFDLSMLAWLATSVATVAGALGGSLESNETVRNATYGYRQRARYRQARDALRFQSNRHDRR